MKQKSILIILALLITIPTMAQTNLVDLYQANDSQVRARFGEPIQCEIPEGFGGYCYEYENMVFWYDNTTGNRHLEGFEIANNRVKVLTNFITGGVKVGDSFSKVLNANFIHTKYGKNNSKNGLQTETGYLLSCGGVDINSTHILFKEEYQYFVFTVENNIIKAIAMYSKDDCPDEGYSYSNSVFGQQ